MGMVRALALNLKRIVADETDSASASLSRRTSTSCDPGTLDEFGVSAEFSSTPRHSYTAGLIKVVPSSGQHATACHFPVDEPDRHMATVA
jgi:hypothetical protein